MSEAIGTREFAEKFGVTLATVSKWCVKEKSQIVIKTEKAHRGIFQKMLCHRHGIPGARPQCGQL